MIVRISTEDQYRMPDEHQGKLNELDNAVVSAVDAQDEARFKQTFAELLSLVRDHGKKLGDDELAESDVIVPPPDLSLEEARADFTGAGLIPD